MAFYWQLICLHNFLRKFPFATKQVIPKSTPSTPRLSTRTYLVTKISILNINFITEPLPIQGRLKVVYHPMFTASPFHQKWDPHHGTKFQSPLHDLTFTARASDLILKAYIGVVWYKCIFKIVGFGQFQKFYIPPQIITSQDLILLQLIPTT